MSVLWHHDVRTGKLTPSEFVSVTSTNCAKIFNMYPQKGSMGIGADADIVIWDPEASKVISADTHYQNIDYNIYEGMEVTGLAATTISRGKVVWHDGDLRTVRGAGRNVKRPPFPSYWDAIHKRNELAEPTPVIRK